MTVNMPVPMFALSVYHVCIVYCDEFIFLPYDSTYAVYGSISGHITACHMLLIRSTIWYRITLRLII